jgi:AcrR family transcriptional regulator
LPAKKPASPSPDAAEPAPRNAGGTRARILAAARGCFSNDSYERVGSRDIAAAAGVDAALVNRYFGGKEKLFAEALEGAFLLENHLGGSSGGLEGFAASLVAGVLGPAGARADQFDALRLLLRASGSPATAALISGRFHQEFVKPLAKRLRGRDTEARAALIASYLLGLAAMKHVLGSPSLAGPSARRASASAVAAIQACLDG